MSEVHAQGNNEACQPETRHLIQLADNLDDFVVVLRLDGTCAWCNRSFANLLGAERESLLGKAYPLPELRELMVHRARESVETWVQLESGQNRLIRFNADAGLDTEGCVESLLITGRDLTPFYRLQHPLAAAGDKGLLLASDDQVQARIKHALDRAQRAQEYVGFMAIQVSGTGQQDLASQADVLNQVVASVRQKIRQGDTLARLESGAYLLVLEQIDCPEAIGTVVEKFSALLHEGAPELETGYAINTGVAISPDDGVETAELIERAQQAMQRAIMDEQQIAYF
ncbi:diguanylate cyclase domain-containing protein [Marinobacterium stanieri]|uniref:diguanylate cyclase domain-containing protein n=1 Tax=Marinobacterium stanieri TaxID=49186 RepID=UPI000255783D|nr:diguanylate cyclase [Marinobacterium stanieri]